MSHKVKFAFLTRQLSVDVTRLVPTRTLDGRDRTHEKYKQIAASIAAVGVIEPLVVFGVGKGSYRILDGHKRHDILMRANTKKAPCIIATEDENYTYNRRVNYLSPVSEHHMILRALEHNSEELIATALNVNVGTIRLKRDLLNGVCKEAVDVLKDQRVTARAFSVLKKMKPVRQVEAAQLMLASHTYTGRFAEALLSGTRDELLVLEGIDQSTKGPSREQKARLERETERMIHDLRAVEDSYGTDVLTLSVLAKYVTRVVANGNVRRFLKQHHGELLETLDTLISCLDAEAA